MRLTPTRWRRFAADFVAPRLKDAGGDDWQIHDHGIARNPTNWLLTGLIWDGMSNDGYSAMATIVPLYSPLRQLILNHSTALANPHHGTRFAADATHLGELQSQELTHAFLRPEAQAFLSNGTDPGGFSRWLIQNHGATPGADVAEWIGYGFVITGAFDQARPFLHQASQAGSDDDFVRGIAQRSTEILDLIEQGRRDAAMTAINDWADHSAASIGVVRQHESG